MVILLPRLKMFRDFLSRCAMAAKALWTPQDRAPKAHPSESDEELIASVRREMQGLNEALEDAEASAKELDDVLGEVFAAAEDPTLSEKDRAALMKMIADATAGFQKGLEEFEAEHDKNMAEFHENMHRFDASHAEVTDRLARAKKDRKGR